MTKQLPGISPLANGNHASVILQKSARPCNLRRYREDALKQGFARFTGRSHDSCITGDSPSLIVINDVHGGHGGVGLSAINRSDRPPC